MNLGDWTEAPSHFAFGSNWAEYARKITEAEIERAVRSLARLLGERSVKNVRFLDIGSGSGLHSLAALRLGAREVLAVDIDRDSAETTRALLERFAPGGANWIVERASVFDLLSGDRGRFDVVYSWGVLHHTGDMVRAIRHAASLVDDDGHFVFALYRRIWMDWFWRREKRWYAQASPSAQARARAIRIALFRLGLRVTGRKLADYIANYGCNRGMDFYHDVHDWMGGWPYDSVSTSEVEEMMRELGFVAARVFARKGRLLGRDCGFFGSGCDEYVYRRMKE